MLLASTCPHVILRLCSPNILKILAGKRPQIVISSLHYDIGAIKSVAYRTLSAKKEGEDVLTLVSSLGGDRPLRQETAKYRKTLRLRHRMRFWISLDERSVMHLRWHGSTKRPVLTWVAASPSQRLRDSSCYFGLSCVLPRALEKQRRVVES